MREREKERKIQGASESITQKGKKESRPERGQTSLSPCTTPPALNTQLQTPRLGLARRAFSRLVSRCSALSALGPGA